MPSFKSHRIFNYLMFALLCIALWRWDMLTLDPMLLLAVFAGYVIGTELITPDLDIDSIPAKRCGWLWSPYKVLFKHRKSSHSFILGLIGRIIYLAIIVVLSVAAFGWLMNMPDLPMQFFRALDWLLVALLVLGIGMANGAHIMLDKIVHRG